MNIININKFNNKLLLVLCLIVALLLGNAVDVHADSAPPPPSIDIKINNVDKDYYVALFTDKESEYYQYYEVFRNEEIDNIFLSYQDNFYYGYQCQVINGDNNEYIFNYMRSDDVDEFKIVLYDPTTMNFIESPTQTHENNDSYTYDIYTNLIEVNNFDFSFFEFLRNSLSFIISVLITIGLELLIGYFYKIRDTKSMVTICIVNFITQSILFLFNRLNNGLNMSYLVLAEFIILIIEAAVYYYVLNISKFKRIIYAIVANLVSATIGSILSIIISFVLYGILRGIIFSIFDIII